MLNNGFTLDDIGRADEALDINELDWSESPLVDIIDALIYDGGFSSDDAVALAEFYA